MSHFRLQGHILFSYSATIFNSGHIHFLRFSRSLTLSHTHNICSGISVCVCCILCFWPCLVRALFIVVWSTMRYCVCCDVIHKRDRNHLDSDYRNVCCNIKLTIIIAKLAKAIKNGRHHKFGWHWKKSTKMCLCSLSLRHPPRLPWPPPTAFVLLRLFLFWVFKYFNFVSVASI